MIVGAVQYGLLSSAHRPSVGGDQGARTVEKVMVGCEHPIRRLIHTPGSA